MGYVTCGIHGVRCCWRCDRCPKCDDIGPVRRGDYCGRCTRYIIAHGGRWNPYTKDYDPPGEGSNLFPADEIATADAYAAQQEGDTR